MASAGAAVPVSRLGIALGCTVGLAILGTWPRAQRSGRSATLHRALRLRREGSGSGVPRGP
eukprot:9898764-Alexandrium_andersonii.AAC.1